MKTPIRFDEYYLVERIAVGGMAEVFKGVTYSDEGFERQMAVKRVLPHIAEDKDFIEMFIDEAKLVSQLQHPNIPQVYHLGKHEDQYFISMEFISGQDVRSVFDRAKAQGIKLDLGVCANIVMEVCDALDYAHRKTNAHQEPLHLIHRDVSPQNIIISYDGSVKLIDFGIAKAVGQINQTQAGILKGKFSYMSPEQARGYKIDARSDLFGLGAVLYELITLERCFLGQTDFSTIERVRNTEYKLPRKIRREIPAQLEKIVRKSLAKDPNDRFQSAADFQEALRVFVRTHQLQRSRAQISTYMSSIFVQEIQSEQNRFADFRAYASQHIPEAQKSIETNRFNHDAHPHIHEQQRPRFALDNEIKLSLQPHSTSADLHLEAHKLTDPAQSIYQDQQSIFPSRDRLFLLVLLAILTGSLIAATTWIKKPLLSAVIFEDPQGLNPNYRLIGEQKQFEGQAPDLVKIEEAGSYLLELSLAKQKQVSQQLDLESGQIIKVSAFGEKELSNQILYLSSEPRGTKVFVDQKFIGQTPLKIHIGQQKHTVLLQADGYQTQELLLQADSQQVTSRHIKLLPQYRTLSLQTNIEDAVISLKDLKDSKQWMNQGRQKATITLNNTVNNTVRIQATGYESRVLSLAPSAKAFSEKWIALKPDLTTYRLKGALDLYESTQVNQSTNQKRQTIRTQKEAVQEIPTSVSFNSNTQSKKIKKRTAKKRKIKPKYTRKPKPRVQVKPRKLKNTQPGFLKLIAIPPAEAFIDGKSVGWTPLINHKLSEGRHRIKLRYQSGEEKTFVQTIAAGRVSLRRVKR